MSGFFDQLEAQLLDAARAELAVRPPSRRRPLIGRRSARRLRLSLSGVLTGMLLVIAVGVAGLILVLAHPVTRPSSVVGGSSSTPQGLVEALASDVARHDPSCRVLVVNGVAVGRPATLLRVLAVLRRPPGAGDAAFGRLERSAALVLPRGRYERFIRRARAAFGYAYYLMPVLLGGRVVPVPHRCVAEQLQRLRAVVRTIHDSSQRSRLAAASRRIIARERRVLRPTEVIDLVEFATARVRGTGAAIGLSAADISAGRGVGPGVGGASLNARASIVTYVVPDGVASVTMYFPPGPFTGSQTPRGHVSRPYRHGATVTATVTGNLAAAIVPRDSGSVVPKTVTWRSASGVVIKTFTPCPAGEPICP